MSVKIVGLDIEATDLKPDFGTVLSVGLKQLGKRPKMFSIQDYPEYVGTWRSSVKPDHVINMVRTAEDKLLLEDVHRVMSEADIWMGWYSKGYDIKFLNARMLIAGLPPLPPVPHIDLYYIAKAHFNLSSNRLAAWQEFLDLPVEKTPLLRKTWREAGAGDPQALRYVERHCYKDTEVLEGVYRRLRPFIRTHPFINGPSFCRVCGGRLQRRGYQLTTNKKPKQRVQCQNPECGAWDLRDLAMLAA